MKVAVIGHDASDAALAKRVGQMRGEGHEVHVFTFRRGEERPRDRDHTDLGRTRDGALVRRLAAIARAVPLVRRGAAFGAAEVVWARNTDAALVARLALSGHRTPLVYECLDVHDSLSGRGPVAMAARRLEGSILDRAALTVVSSPAFVTEHLTPRYGARPTMLIENRLAGGGLPPRPGPRERGGPLTIGWFGILRCARSLSLLRETAGALQGALRVVIAGRPALGAVPRFGDVVAADPYLSYRGAYENPRDLAGLYASCDLVWVGDLAQDGANSRWLLPNRLYEGGWFGVPALALAGTETARWVERNGTGLVLERPTPDSLAAMLGGLTPERLSSSRSAVLRAPDSLFAAPPGEVTAALREAAS